jgi:hypothetical protein
MYTGEQSGLGLLNRAFAIYWEGGAMASLTRQAFVDLLLQAARLSRAVAQEQITGSLPEETCWVLGAWEHDRRETALGEIIGFLYRDGRFPVYVNVTINGIVENRTIIRLGPSGHAFVDDTEQTGNAAAGLGPFKPLGLMLPGLIWYRPRPLSLQDLREAAAETLAHDVT